MLVNLAQINKCVLQAGYLVEADGSMSAALIATLVTIGDEATVAARLKELLDAGLDELLVALMPLDDEAAERWRLFDLVGSL